MRFVLPRIWLACMGVILLGGASAFAAPHEVRVPLHDGKLQPADLCRTLCQEMHLPQWKSAGVSIDLTSLHGSLFVHAMNTALGAGCTLHIDRDALVLHLDPEKLPANCDDAQRAIRVFTTEAAPQAAARQASQWGLFLPDHLDPHRPLVVLIHGLDSEKECMGAMAELLRAEHHQVAFFGYPDDQPIADSARFLAERMADLRQTYPDLRVNIVAHSMGGLVARDYLEGPAYSGGVDRLIMIGTPNGGSTWAVARFLLELQEQYQQWRHTPGYSCTWTITDGMGEAGRDLKPHSKFLEHLNGQPRRPGVKYTIVAGNQAPTSRYYVEMSECTASVFPKRTQNWWGIRHCESGLAHCASHYRQKTGDSDGPVTLESAKLPGVTDMVILPADHTALIFPTHGNPPAAWKAVEERLK